MRLDGNFTFRNSLIQAVVWVIASLWSIFRIAFAGALALVALFLAGAWLWDHLQGIPSGKPVSDEVMTALANDFGNMVLKETRWITDRRRAELTSQQVLAIQSTSDFSWQLIGGQSRIKGIMLLDDRLIIELTPSRWIFDYHTKALVFCPDRDCDGDMFLQNQSDTDEFFTTLTETEKRSSGWGRTRHIGNGWHIQHDGQNFDG